MSLVGLANKEAKRKMTVPTNKTIVYVCPSSSVFLHHHSHLAIEAAKGNAVHVILADDDEKAFAALSDAGLTVHRMDLSRSSVNPARILWEARTLRRRLARLKPDVINAINLKAVLVAALANVGTKVKLVGTIPGLGYMFIGNSLHRKALRNATALGLRCAFSFQKHVLVFSNRDDVEEFIIRKVTEPENMRVIPVPGIDTREFAALPEPESGFRVVLPARMLWDKGVGEFVAAATELRSLIENAEFLLAGAPDPGNPTSISSEQLEQWTREGNVRWLGHCTDMAGLLASCHVVCLPSKYREGFPRVLAEAMACSRAIVTTDAPGCRDIGSDVAILVEPGNADMLKNALLRLYHNPRERRERAQRGARKVSREFRRETIISNMLACYPA